MVPENGLHSGGLNPGLLGRESSASTTRPQLFAKIKIFFGLIKFLELVLQF
jgi:hypothetical protein